MSVVGLYFPCAKNRFDKSVRKEDIEQRRVKGAFGSIGFIKKAVRSMFMDGKDDDYDIEIGSTYNATYKVSGQMVEVFFFQRSNGTRLRPNHLCNSWKKIPQMMYGNVFVVKANAIRGIGFKCRDFLLVDYYKLCTDMLNTHYHFELRDIEEERKRDIEEEGEYSRSIEEYVE